MTPSTWITKIIFSGGTEIALNRDDIVVVVGANNVGKSAALRGIRYKLVSNKNADSIIKNISFEKVGDTNEILNLLKKIGRRSTFNPRDNYLSVFGLEFNLNEIIDYWEKDLNGLGQLTRLFCNLLSAGGRLQITDPAPNIAITKDPVEFPSQWMMRDDELELVISEEFRRAFNTDLIIHRNGGTTIPLYVGERPVPEGSEDRASLSYNQRIEKLSLIHEQGDGMRGFAGIVMALQTGFETVLMIDEPEAFLHPPQARHMGHMLAGNQTKPRQLFIATHSGDVLRGILDAGSNRVRILRLKREDNANYVQEIRPVDITKIWGDPLLRHSNVLDGIFYEKVVVCESDSDAKFYSAIADILYDTHDTKQKKPDVMFTHCGGKDRIATVVKALKAVGVPVVVVADFDVLNGERPLRDIVEAAQGEWQRISTNWNKVKVAVEEKKPEIDLPQLKTRISEAIDQISSPDDLKQAQRKISNVWKVASPWGTAKTVGRSYLPSGQATVAYNQLIVDLKSLGIFVVEIGELECFVRSVGSHGPKWVNEVLIKNLAEDDELEPARFFVNEFLGFENAVPKVNNRQIKILDSSVNDAELGDTGIEKVVVKESIQMMLIARYFKKLVLKFKS